TLRLSTAVQAAPGTWSLTGSLSTARQWHTATLLGNGLVLVAGGMDAAGNPLATAELYDPASGTWLPTGRMNIGRARHTATLLPTGQVLVTGGVWLNIELPGPGATAELYDPASGTWHMTGGLHDARESHTATLLPTGQVLVAGGWGDFFDLPLAT